MIQSASGQTNPKPLARIVSRDQKLLEATLNDYEKHLWPRNPYKVIQESFLAFEKKEILYRLSRYDTYQSRMRPDREKLLLKWILELPLENSYVRENIHRRDTAMDLARVAQSLSTRQDTLNSRYLLREAPGHKGQTTEILIEYVTHRCSRITSGIRVYTTRGTVVVRIHESKLTEKSS